MAQGDSIRTGTVPARFHGQMSVPEVHEYLSRPSRRRFLQGAAVTAGLLAAGPTAFIRSARAAGAPPAGTHLAFGADPRHEMSVVWSTPGPVDNPRLTLGNGDGLGTVVAAETRTLPTSLRDPLGSPETHYHRVRLGGLDPATSYGYQLQHDGGDPTLLQTFSTAPSAAAPFTFTAFGDQGVSAAGVAVIDQITAIAPAFNLIAGDLCYADGLGTTLPIDVADFDPLVWNAWFAQAVGSARTTPWMPSMGNHDVEPGFGEKGFAGHQARLALPRNGFSDVTYSFQYGNVAVLALDANDVSSEIPHPYSLGGQTAWLDRELGRLRSDPTVDFIVAHFHHCAFCTITSHGSDGGVRRDWVPVFDRHGVDLVINGHNHGYERTTPIKGGAPSTEAPTGATVHPQQHGTTYICAGGGGRSPNDLGPPGMGFLSYGPAAHELKLTGVPESAPWSVKAVANNSFLRVEVAPPDAQGVTTMSVTAIDRDGTAFDSIVLSRQRAVAPAATTTTTSSVAPATDEKGPTLPATGGGGGTLLPVAAVGAGLALAAATRAGDPEDAPVRPGRLGRRGPDRRP